MLVDAIVPKDLPSASDLRYSEVDEEFVDVYKYSCGRILVEMRYYLAGRDGAVNTAYARRTVADRLMRAASLLPEGYRLKIYDAWRPYEVQRSLFDEYLGALRAMSENAGLSEDVLCEMAKTFVSMPDRGIRFAYVHSSGGAIDLTVVAPDGNELDMGCGFDDFTPVAHTAALEGSDAVEQRDNRRLLYHVMSEAGFTNFPSEWWHYDFGDKFWAAMTDCDVKYPSVYAIEEMKISSDISA